MDEAIRSVDYPGLPDFVRIVREPFEEETVEIEFLLVGELQGRIYDVPPTAAAQWFRLQGIPTTSTLERALDSAWNFGEVIYIPSEDRLIPR